MPLSIPQPAQSLWTVASLEQLPDDGNRYEILHGELLVTPSPRFLHQQVVAELVVTIGNWCRASSGWRVLAPGVVRISETSSLEPDIAVYPVPAHGQAWEWHALPPPCLVVEVLSASTTKADRHRKRPAYLAHGVAEVWLIDADARSYERWTSASEFPVLHHGSITWSPIGGSTTLTISETEVFGARANRSDM